MAKIFPILCLLWFVSSHGFTQEIEAIVPEPILIAMQGILFEKGYGSTSAWERLEESRSKQFILGWDLLDFGLSGDTVWEVPLMEHAKFTTAVFWYNVRNGHSHIVIIEAERREPTLEDPRYLSPEPKSWEDLANTPSLEQAVISDVPAAHRAALKALGTALKPDERIEIQPAFQIFFSIKNFCPMWAWMWPCRIMAGTNELRGLYWINAANGALHPLAVRP